MAAAPSTREVVEKRRDIVASLLARGMRQTEIIAQLGTEYLLTPTGQYRLTPTGQKMPNPVYLINPKTGEPFNKATISRDVKALKIQWRENSEANAEDHFSRQLAEIQELKRVAWAAKNLSEIRQLIALEMKLLGTAKPEKKELRWEDEQFKKLTEDDLPYLSDDDLTKIAAGSGIGVAEEA